ncbi:MAG TPA: NAD(P)H-hydrate dehydratase, partial [Terriglobales bacterium]|nr:NAD(P)H-hydrate dehydratase [Terriglobales bacterium]
VAVDIPSGLDADAMAGAPTAGPVVPACATVTFTAPRPAHVFSPLVKGPVVVAPIGSPEEAIQSELNLELITPHDIAEMAALRPRDSHKGMYGHVLVIGGSLGKAGAAAMAGMAALRAGAGLVTVATAESVLPTVAGFAPELMTEPLPETEAGTISLRAREYGRLDGIIKGKTVLAIGPGISRQTETAELVRFLVRGSQLPMVLDADGLNAFEGRAQELTGRPLVITPHPGEMARLAQLSTRQIQEDRLQVARDFATRHGITTVLKGHRTLIAQPDGTIWVNPTGNPGMASGGMGDILTGLTAGMLAQTTHSITAVLGAVYLHGLAGDVACEKTGEQSLIATDLLAALPEAFRRVREEAAKPIVRFLA